MLNVSVSEHNKFNFIIGRAENVDLEASEILCNWVVGLTAAEVECDIVGFTKQFKALWVDVIGEVGKYDATIEMPNDSSVELINALTSMAVEIDGAYKSNTHTEVSEPAAQEEVQSAQQPQPEKKEGKMKAFFKKLGDAINPVKATKKVVYKVKAARANKDENAQPWYAMFNPLNWYRAGKAKYAASKAARTEARANGERTVLAKSASAIGRALLAPFKAVAVAIDFAVVRPVTWMFFNAEGEARFPRFNKAVGTVTHYVMVPVKMVVNAAFFAIGMALGVVLIAVSAVYTVAYSVVFAVFVSLKWVFGLPVRAYNYVSGKFSKSSDDGATAAA